MEQLKAILADWRGKASVAAIALFLLTAVLTAVSERFRKILSKVLVAYLASKWRFFWYWITNKTFWVSSTFTFTFAANMSDDRTLLNEFNDGLRRTVTSGVEGQLAVGISLRLIEIGNAELRVTAETGSVLAAQFAGADGLVNDSTAPPAKTILTIQAESIVIHYREFKKTLDSLRRTVDQIRDAFARLVENKVQNQRTVTLDVFFRRDHKVDRSVIQKIPASDVSVQITRVDGMTHFGADQLDPIISHLPHYLVRETISDLLKRHGLVT